MSALEGGYRIQGKIVSAFARSVAAHVGALSEPNFQVISPLLISLPISLQFLSLSSHRVPRMLIQASQCYKLIHTLHPGPCSHRNTQPSDVVINIVESKMLREISKVPQKGNKGS